MSLDEMAALIRRQTTTCLVQMVATGRTKVAFMHAGQVESINLDPDLCVSVACEELNRRVPRAREDGL